jgi:hypothetical protein
VPASAVDAAAAVAKSFVAATPVSQGALDETALLPGEGLDRDSISLSVSDALGFDRFDNVFTAQYQVDGQPATVFLSVRPSPEEAAELAEAFRAFLVTNGGKELPAPSVAGAKAAELFGSYELVFARGRVLAGVHEAPSLAAAEKLAGSIERRLAEVAP